MPAKPRRESAPNEETPLLIETSRSRASSSSAERQRILEATDVGGQGLDPEILQNPLRRTSTYTSDGFGASHNEDSASTDGEDAIATESPYLSGVTKTRFWLIFGCVLLQIFVATFDSTLMASSHPVITSYFNASNSASWLSTAFLLTSTSLQPLYGRLSDTVGRRPPHLFSLVVLCLATVWCAFAQSIGSLIAARALCGVGAGGVLSMGAILTNDMVPIELRGTYQSYINLLFGLGNSCGAAFGGFLVETIGWRWTFGIQIPLMLATLILAYFTVPSSLGQNLAKTSNQSGFEVFKSFDILGSLFLTLSVATLIMGMNLGGNVFPWNHPIVIASLVVAGLSSLLLIWIESRAQRPVMPLKLLSTKPRGQLVFSNFFAQIGQNTLVFNVPLFFQAVNMESATISGLRFAPATIASLMSAVAVGFIITVTRKMKIWLVAGSLSILLGSICMANVNKDMAPWWGTLFLLPNSIGQGLAMPTTSIAILVASSQEDQAVTTSTLSLFRQLGTVLGVSISSLILQNSLSQYLHEFVTGKDKAEIILIVRKSVHAIHDLNPIHQAEVTYAYSKALQLTFLLAVATAICVNLLLLPVKVPRLTRKR